MAASLHSECPACGHHLLPCSATASGIHPITAEIPTTDPDRICDVCGADALGNDPHEPGCPVAQDPAYIAWCQIYDALARKKAAPSGYVVCKNTWPSTDDEHPMVPGFGDRT